MERLCLKRLMLVLVFGLVAAGCSSDEGPIDPPIDPPDEPTGLWVTAAPLPAAIHSFGAAVYRDRIYVIGGDDEIFRSRNSVYRLDPVTGQWETLNTLPRSRTSPSVAVVGDSLYVAGGMYRFNATTELLEEVWVYQPDTDTWEERAPLASPRMEAAAAALNGELYLIGGRDLSGQFTPGDSIVIYNPQLNAWRLGTPPLHARAKATAVTFNNRIYLINGEIPLNLSNAIVQIEAYDPTTQSWTDIADLATVRVSTGIALRGSSLHVVSGVGRNLDETPLHEVLDLNTLAWTELRGLPSASARRDHRAAVLADQLFVMGGQRLLEGPLDLVHRFDPGATTRVR